MSVTLRFGTTANDPACDVRANRILTYLDLGCDVFSPCSRFAGPDGRALEVKQSLTLTINLTGQCHDHHPHMLATSPHRASSSLLPLPHLLHDSIWTFCLDVTDNSLGPEGGVAMARALTVNTSLTGLNMGCE